LHRLESLGELLKIKERLDLVHDLRLPLRHAPEKLLHDALLRHVGVVVVRHMLYQIGQPHGKVLDLLAGLEGEGFPLSEPLQRRSAYAVTANLLRGDRVPRQLHRGLVGEGNAELSEDGGTKSLQGLVIVIVDDAAMETASHKRRAWSFTFISKLHSW